MATFKGKKIRTQLHDFDKRIKKLGDELADVDPTILTDAAEQRWKDKPMTKKKLEQNQKAEERALKGIPKVPGIVAGSDDEIKKVTPAAE